MAMKKGFTAWRPCQTFCASVRLVVCPLHMAMKGGSKQTSEWVWDPGGALQQSVHRLSTHLMSAQDQSSEFSPQILSLDRFRLFMYLPVATFAVAQDRLVRSL